MRHHSEMLHLGAAYYPEHWPEARWIEDVRLMVAAGITVVRMGEFAWSTLEPREGELHIEWLNDAIRLLAENRIKTILATPTASPPAWLTHIYTNTLAVDRHGHPYERGRRYRCCINSPDFNRQTRSIVSQMAKHFGPDPNVIGWQIDIDLGTVCYCDICRTEFQSYLKDQFESLDSLNECWNTRFWSQTYTAWDQIHIPTSGDNPALMLSFQQFLTRSYKKFQKLQIDILRPHLKENVWITNNFTNWHSTCDLYEMSDDLDIVSRDWHVGAVHTEFTESSAAHDLVRGFKSRNYWLMETQPTRVSQSSITRPLKKGVYRALAWHAVGHGADAILGWSWRTALNGPDQHHGTLLDTSGQPRPFYSEAAQMGRDFSRVSNLIAGSNIKARVAILNDYNSRWSLDWSHQYQEFDYFQHLTHYYIPFAARNIPVDIISPDGSLGGYRLVIAPGLAIINPERAQELTKFVERGGTLILTIQSGMKDTHNTLLPMRQPGLLAHIANVEVEEYYPLDTHIPVKGALIGSGLARYCAERLHIIDKRIYTQPAARYGVSNGWLDDQLAISFNPYGMGGVYYVGTYLDGNAQAEMLGTICSKLSIKPVMTTPPGVEACQRIAANGDTITILINHQNGPKEVEIPWAAREHLGGGTGKGQLTLAPYGVAVLTKEEQK